MHAYIYGIYLLVHIFNTSPLQNSSTTPDMVAFSNGESIYFSCGWRRIGRPFTGNGEGLYMIFSFGTTFSHLNLVTILWINTSITNRTYSFPGHSRGPPPKGTKVYGAGPFPSNLEGSNFSGSGKYLGFLFVECTLQYVCKKMKSYMVSYVNQIMHTTNRR